MKKRQLVLCLILLICVMFFCGLKIHDEGKMLAEEYPAVVTGEYDQVQLLVINETIDVQVSNESLRGIFGAGCIKRAVAQSGKTPDYAFELRMTDGQEGYVIVVGFDRSIVIAQIGDLGKSRTFWTDVNGDIFEELYNLYLNNGGKDVLLK